MTAPAFDLERLAVALEVSHRWDDQVERQRLDLQRALEGLWSCERPERSHWSLVAALVDSRALFLETLRAYCADAKVHTKARQLQRDELYAGRRIPLKTARTRVLATTHTIARESL